MANDRTLIGIDGCKLGWIAAIRDSGKICRLKVFPTFADILLDAPADALLVVDMPIGLPDHVEGAGRVAEQAIRSVLRNRRSSVFATPARPVVERYSARPKGMGEILASFAHACELARRHSTPASAFSVQGFSLLPRIAEVDQVLRSEPVLAQRVFEGHPEVAFAVLNGGAEMAFSKKTSEGKAERRELLLRLGLPADIVTSQRPRGASEDDRLDAGAMLLVAQRIAEQRAISFPDPPERDAYGLPIAIWA